MKSLLTIKTSSLEDYDDFAKVNENWTMLSYLNMRYDSNAAVAFSKLFFPDFIEHKGCIIIGLFFNEFLVNVWLITLKGDTSKVEKVCNSYALGDLFHINNQEKPELIFDLGKALEMSWSLNTKRLFPDRDISVSLYDESGVPSITMYSSR